MSGKNIILMTVDCLRADRLSCMGYKRQTTPHLDRLAREGTLFSQASSVSTMTKQSVPAILGSFYPSMCENLDNPFKNRQSIAEILKKKGYATGAFHSNVVISQVYGYQKGFDKFEDDLNRSKKAENHIRKLKKNPVVRFIVNKVLNKINRARLAVIGGANPKKNAEAINDQAIEWIKQQKGSYFAWIHYMDAHGPYLPPQDNCIEFHGKKVKRADMFKLWNKMLGALKDPSIFNEEEIDTIIALYDSCIRHVDRCINELIKNLESINKLKDTVIIITADHGEEFAEHGNLSHHRKLYEELIRVPLIVYNLDGFEYKTVDTPVSLIDIAPTIADIAGIANVSGFSGVSLLQKIKKPGEKTEGTISETDALFKGKKIVENVPVIAYRTSDWKLIQVEKHPSLTELYDLKQDPGETKNLSESSKEKVKELEKFISEHKRRIEQELSEKRNISSALSKIKI